MLKDQEKDQSDLPVIIYPQLLNPFRYVKVLIQLGYEPLEPKYSHNLLSFFNISKKTLRYPNVLYYVKFIWQKRGVYHVLSTGFLARVFGDSLGHANEQILKKYICENNYDEIEDAIEEKEWIDFFKLLGCILVMKSYEVIITFPFKVIMTRQMAEFIVSDTKSLWFYETAKIVYASSGITGFYKGVVPALIGELFKSSVYFISCRLIYWAFKDSDKNRIVSIEQARSKSIRLLPRTMMTFLCSYLFYPFEVVTTVMMLDGVYLTPNYRLSNHGSWYKCWSTLKKTNQLERGYSSFFRNHVQN